MHGIRHLVTVLVLFAFPTTLILAGGQRSRPDVFSENELTRLDTIIAEAVTAGIPESTLQRRVDEGVAKGADASRIFEALAEKIARMEQSRDLLDGIDGGRRIRAGQADWEWTAILLEAGVAQEEITATARASLTANRHGDYRNATAAYLELIRDGILPQDAGPIVRALLESDLPASAFLEIDDLVLRGGSDLAARNQIAQIIREQLPDIDSMNQLTRIVRTWTTANLDPPATSPGNDTGDDDDRPEQDAPDDDDDDDESDEEDEDEEDD